MRVINAAVAGFGSAVYILLLAGAIVGAAWAASYLRDRSSDQIRTARMVGLAVLGIALLSAAMFSGRRITMFFFLLTLFGVPVAIGMAPRGYFKNLIKPDSGGAEDHLGDRLR
ncbi:MAG: hypothetical protein ABFS34_02765 [Gemmatimonadota bacterium]